MGPATALLGVIEGAVCDLPVEWRLQVLEARVRENWDDRAVTIETMSVERLDAAEMSRLFSEVYAAGNEFPVALVGDHIVCANGLDVFAVLAALDATV